MGFRQSLQVGRFAERYLTQILTGAGASVRSNSERTRESLAGWDLEVAFYRIPFRVEVKFDVMASKTGNLAVEYYNTSLCCPSGIEATTADLWCVVLHQPMRAYLATVPDLKAYCSLVRPWRDIACGGDGNAAMWLYPAHEILEDVFVRVDDLPEKDVLNKVIDMLGEPFGMEHAEAMKRSLCAV